jgi:tetratricopeptide (TPR) repeat protein
LAACEAALELAPDDAEAHRVRISALMELKRYDAVLASADTYIARGKPSAKVFEIRGLARETRRDDAGAVADFNRALELTPDAEPPQRSRLLNLRGWAYQFADLPRMALPDFEESLRLVPRHSDALCGRALARIRLGEWQPAVVDAEAAVRLAKARNPHTWEDRQAQTQALFNAARVYALAVEFAIQDVSRQGERPIVLYRKYRSRALDLLDEALQQVPDRDRRDEMENDPALRSLRRRASRNPGVRFSSLTQDRNAR